MKLSLLVLAATAACLQVPFALDTSLEAPTRPHYSTLEAHDIPIDLAQYENQVVVRATKTPELLKQLRQGRHKVWALSRTEGTVDFQISADDLDTLVSTFTVQNPTVVVKDLAQAVFETYPEGFKKDDFLNFKAKSTEEIANSASDEVSAKEKLRIMGEVFFKLYRPLESIDAWLDLLLQSYPDIVKIDTIGETYEGRPYNVVHVSVPDDDVSHGDKKTIVITGGVHAREWISVSSVLYTVYAMLDLYESNPDDLKELAKLDFLFIPVLNPDGYEYSWTTDRLWRKNRQAVEGGDNVSCLGIDIDHSYDFHWTESSDSACGEEYAGSSPFEAYELRIWDTYLNHTNEGHKIWGYVDLHSYSQEVLYPYAFSCDQLPRDEENLIELAYGISKTIRLTSGKYYAVLPACIDRDSDLIPDLGAGTALDYMYHHKLYWAYQIKLRDSGSHGFLLPEKYIQPVGEEISAGLKYFIKFILSDD